MAEACRCGSHYCDECRAREHAEHMHAATLRAHRNVLRAVEIRGDALKAVEIRKAITKLELEGPHGR